MFFSDYLDLSEYYKVGLIYKKPLQKANLAILGSINLVGSLYVGIYPEGLYLSILPLFRVKGAKLLLITWSDIENLETQQANTISLKIGPKKTKLILTDKSLFEDFSKLMTRSL